jgi:ketosteroid isomerase-like protein
MMRKVFLLVALMVPISGVLTAQQSPEDKAVRDQKAIEEVTKIEKDKIPLLVKSGPGASDWFDSHNADDLAYQDPDAGVLTKAQVSAELRAGTRKPSSIKQYDHKVRVYGNGDVAVVTYLGDVTGKKDKAGNTLAFVSHEATTDVWVKQDGVWKRVVHSVTRLPAE